MRGFSYESLSEASGSAALPILGCSPSRCDASCRSGDSHRRLTRRELVGRGEREGQGRKEHGKTWEWELWKCPVRPGGEGQKKGAGKGRLLSSLPICESVTVRRLGSRTGLSWVQSPELTTFLSQSLGNWSHRLAQGLHLGQDGISPDHTGL